MCPVFKTQVLLTALLFALKLVPEPVVRIELLRPFAVRSPFVCRSLLAALLTLARSFSFVFSRSFVRSLARLALALHSKLYRVLTLRNTSAQNDQRALVLRSSASAKTSTSTLNNYSTE